jgi:integrase
MGRRAKGEGGLFKVRGSRFWYGQYVHNGKQVRVSTGKTLKMEAQEVLRRLIGDRDRGLPPLPDAQKVRYADLRRGLIADYEAKGNRSLTTNADGEDYINGLPQLDEFFGYNADNPGPPVTQITTDTSREFAKKRRSQGVGSAMVNRSLACLRRMLRIAHEDGKIQIVPKIRMLKEPKPRKGFLEQKKFDELLNLLPTHLRPLICLLYYCGTRVGESLQIEWHQVDLDARLIWLEDEQTKSEDPRVVPLHSVLVMMLREIEPKEGRVFSGVNLRTEWEKACAACGLGTRTKIEAKKNDDGSASVPAWYKYKGLLVHDLRRSAVRNLRRAGESENVIMKISGHKTAEVFRRYNIVSTDDVTNAMRRLELYGSSDRSVKVPPQSVRRLPVSRSK